MGSPKPDAERAESIERLRVLLNYFATERSTNQTALARQLQRSPAMLTNALKRGVSAELREAFARVGVERRYWDGATRLEPRECVTRMPQPTQEELSIAVAKEHAAHLASRLHAPHVVFAAIYALRPPKGQEGDAWWWVDQVLKLIDEHATTKSKRASA